MRNKTTALFCSALLLATAHGSAALVAASSLTKPQTAEIDKAQETVDLKISGMT